MKSADEWETTLDTVQRIHLNKALRAMQADVLRSEAADMEKDAEEFEASPDLIKTGQWIALTRTAELLRDKADAIERKQEPKG